MKTPSTATRRLSKSNKRFPSQTLATSHSGASCSRRCNATPSASSSSRHPPASSKNQPVYYDKFLRAFELADTRFCRCKRYNAPHRKETVILNNMTCWSPNGWGLSRRMCSSSSWSPNGWGLSRRMCSSSSPCQPLFDNKTRRHQSATAGSNAALSAQFESEMAVDLARARASSSSP